MIKRAAISTRHLYGIGGGARAVAWFAYALDSLGYQVDIYTKSNVDPTVLKWLPTSCRSIASYYPTCGRGYDLLLNIDHFDYAPPLAERNWAHIFHPHGQNLPPEEYELWGNSKYTAGQCQEVWEREAKHIYIPINVNFRQLRKSKMILHSSRFVRPSEFADKAHRQMITTFQQGIDSGALKGWGLHLVGPIDPGMESYFNNLMASTQGYPIYFHVSVDDEEMVQLMGQAAIYWHMTGLTMPEIPGAQEHLGLAPIEAMASGAVPICHATGGHLETIRDGVTGFLARDTQELLKYTATLTDDLTLWANMSEQAARVGVGWKDYRAFVQRVEAMFDGEVMDVPGPKPVMQLYQEQDVTIIIPVYNQWDMTRRMVQSIQATASPARIIVVDNGSEEERPDDLGVEYITHEKNLGYAGAVLSALDRVKTKLVLIANNDMECVMRNWLKVLVSFMEPSVGICGPKLLYPDGRLQFAGGLFDWNRPDIGFHRWYGQQDHPGANMVEAIPFMTGACLLARKELITLPRELERGLNYEDAHWCLNAWYEGYEVRYVPTAALLHYEARTKRAVDESREAILDNRKAFLDLWHDDWLNNHRLSTIRNVNIGMLGGQR